MLNTEDLKQIGGVVKDTVRTEVSDILQGNVIPALDEVHERLDILQQDVSGLKQDVSGIQQDVASLQTDVKAIRSQMVTKDHLDEKLADLRGDLNVLIRKEDNKVLRLIEKLRMKNVLSSVEVKELLEMEPFAKILPT